MYGYPVRPAILPHDARLLVFTGVFFVLLAVCFVIIRRRRDPAYGLLAAFLVNAYMLLTFWHRYPDLPVSPLDAQVRELIFWANMAGWIGLAALSIRNVRRHPASRMTIRLMWAVVSPLLLMWMSTCVYPRSAAQASHCMNQLKLVGISVHNLSETNEGEFPAARPVHSNGVVHSWRIDLLPYLDSTPIRDQYMVYEPWDSPANARTAKLAHHPYRCPTEVDLTDSHGRSFTAYLAVTGKHGLMRESPPGQRMEQVMRDHSNTVMIVEACGQRVPWTEPRDIDIDAVEPAVNSPGREPGRSEGALSARHPGGPGFLMADGSVRRVSPETDPSVIAAMLRTDRTDKPSLE
jgi:prepilin-type processing-associated H-X9-DG protein